MSIKIQTEDLAAAYTNLEEICKSHKNEKAKKLYLTVELASSDKPKKIPIEQIITSIQHSFAFSNDSARLRKVNQMYTWLMQIPPFREQFNRSVLEQVRQSMTFLEETALRQLPERLSTLLHIQEYMEKFSLLIEQASLTRAQNNLFSKNPNYIGRKKVSSLAPDEGRFLQKHLKREDLLTLMESPIGIALAATFGWMSSEKRTYFYAPKDFTLQQLEELSMDVEDALNIADPSSRIHAHLRETQSILQYQFAHANLDNQILNLQPSILKLVNKINDSSHFIHSSFPEFSKFWKNSLSELTPSATLLKPLCELILSLHKSVERVHGIREDLYRMYEEHYNEYQRLVTKKETSRDGLASVATLSLDEVSSKVSFRSFPSPENFASRPFGFTPGFSLTPLPLLSSEKSDDSKEPKREVPLDRETSDSIKQARKKAHRAKQKAKSRSLSHTSSPSLTPSTSETSAPSSSSSSSSQSSLNIPEEPSLSSLSSSSSHTSSFSSPSLMSTPSFRSSSSSPTDVAAPPIMPHAATSSRTPPIPTSTTLFANQLGFSSEIYDQRVIDWFENPDSALSQDTYAALTPHQKEKSTWCHAFSPFVDKFVGTSYSYKDQWVTKKGQLHTFYAVVGEVTWKGKTYRGVFQYCFDNHGVLYHRCFGPKSNIELLDIFINRQRPEIEYPSLAESASLGKAKSKPRISSEGVPYEVDPLKVVSFEDPANGLSIRLFKLGLR